MLWSNFLHPRVNSWYDTPMRTCDTWWTGPGPYPCCIWHSWTPAPGLSLAVDYTWREACTSRSEENQRRALKARWPPRPPTDLSWDADGWHQVPNVTRMTQSLHQLSIQIPYSKFKPKYPCWKFIWLCLYLIAGIVVPNSSKQCM